MTVSEVPRFDRASGWRRWGVRRQLTVAATLAVALPLLLGIVIFSTALHVTLTNSLRGDVLSEARRVAVQVHEIGPEVVADEGELDEGFRAQVIDTSTGAIVGTSTSRLTAPLSMLRPPVGVQATEGATPVWLPGQADVTDLTAAIGVEHAGRPYVLLVSAGQQSQYDFVTVTVRYLLLAVPLLMALSALASHMLVNRALRPVEQITRRVDLVTSRRLHDRVPVPATDDEIATLATTMNRMLERLEASQANQTRFVSDASHELRSPLTTLSGALEIGSAADEAGTWRELAPLMTHETARLEGLVGDLLLLSRADDRGLRLAVADVDVDDLVDSEKQRLRSSRAELEIRATVRAARIQGDREKLLAALRNLDDNAARHARSVVALAVQPRQDGVRITVEDDGSGVPEADRERVFERFVRLDESRSRDSGGAGLGLPIVREVVNGHGGRVWVEASPELGGARFVIELPSAPPGYPQ